MFGLFNLNKPKGATSRDAVNRVQWLLRQYAKARGEKPAKVGHAGTLDPIATGVLVVCVGPATRLIEYVQRMPKQYRGTFLLGQRSPSDDVELEVEHLVDPPQPSRQEIEAALPKLIGRIQQTPPAYSAIKIDGKKAYDLARAGEPPKMEPRPVTIHSIDIIGYEYPEIVLDVRCGSGTYVRSLGRDLAESLGTAAVMSELTRTAIGEFGIADAIDPRQLDEANLAKNLLPATRAVCELPFYSLASDEAVELSHGRPIAATAEITHVNDIALVTADGALFGLGRKKSVGKLWPTRIFKSS